MCSRKNQAEDGRGSRRRELRRLGRGGELGSVGGDGTGVVR